MEVMIIFIVMVGIGAVYLSYVAWTTTDEAEKHRAEKKARKKEKKRLKKLAAAELNTLANTQANPPT